MRLSEWRQSRSVPDRSGVDDVDVEVVPDAVVVVVGVLLQAGVALPQTVRAQLGVAAGQALSPAVSSE